MLTVYISETEAILIKADRCLQLSLPSWPPNTDTRIVARGS